jgi:hypothetical protein
MAGAARLEARTAPAPALPAMKVRRFIRFGLAMVSPFSSGIMRLYSAVPVNCREIAQSDGSIRSPAWRLGISG